MWLAAGSVCEVCTGDSNEQHLKDGPWTML
jgi:hypothetical protein